MSHCAEAKQKKSKKHNINNLFFNDFLYFLIVDQWRYMSFYCVCVLKDFWEKKGQSFNFQIDLKCNRKAWRDRSNDCST